MTASFFDMERKAYIDITDNAIVFVRGKRGILITFYPATVKQVSDLFSANEEKVPVALLHAALENWRKIEKWQKIGKIGAVI